MFSSATMSAPGGSLRRIAALLVTFVLVITGLAAVATPAEATEEADVLFVAGSDDLRRGDRAAVARIKALGYSVDIVRDRNATARDAAGAAAVVISSTVNSRAIGDTFTKVEVPVVTWEPYLYDDLGLTGDRAYRDFGRIPARWIRVVDSDSPLAAGEDGGTKIARRGTVGFGKPTRDADVIAVKWGAPVYFAYEAGTQMVDGKAPALRIAFPASNGSPAYFTKAGKAMFDAAISYAVGQGQGPGSIVDIASGNPDFSILVAAVVKAGLADTLANEGSFTVFAPTNDAFVKLANDLGLDNPAQLLDLDVEVLKDILLYHVVGKELFAADVLASSTLDMLNGDTTAISLRDGMPFINDSKIIGTDIDANNGVIHVIDMVLMPPADEPDPGSIVDIASGNPDFSILVAAVVKAGLADTLANEGSFTVFAPTNDAFVKLANDLGLDNPAQLLDLDVEVLKDILLYHVVGKELFAADVLASSTLDMLNGDTTAISLRDGMPFINDSKIIGTDIDANNGVIHVIDMVLMPPADEPDPGSIVDIASGNDNFDTLVELVKIAGLVDTLDQGGPFTVFAPTNDAFDNLPDWLVALLKHQPELLKQVLLYHVVPGEYLAADVLAEDRLPTVLGPSIRVDADDVEVNGAPIIATDIIANNGVIHVISKVLIPPHFAI